MFESWFHRKKNVKGSTAKKVAPSSNGSVENKKATSESSRASDASSVLTHRSSRIEMNPQSHSRDRLSADLQNWDAASNWDWSKDGTLPKRRQYPEDPAPINKWPTIGCRTMGRMTGKPPLKAASDNHLEKNPISRPRVETNVRPTAVREEWGSNFQDNGGSDLLEQSHTMQTFTRRPRPPPEEPNRTPDINQPSLRNVNSDRWHSRNNFSSSGTSIRQSFLNQSGKKTQHSVTSMNRGSGAQSSQETQDTASSSKEKSRDKNSPTKRRELDGREWTQILPEVVDDITEWYRDCGKELGRGNFGVVSVWESRVSARKVACKSISKSRLRHRKDAEEVKKEIQILKTLKGHQHICQLIETFEDDHKIHLVMELCPGKALSHQILRRKRLTEPEAVHIFRQVVEAVCWTHSRGVMHR